jgi:hypothetical protein
VPGQRQAAWLARRRGADRSEQEEGSVARAYIYEVTVTWPGNTGTGQAPIVTTTAIMRSLPTDPRRSPPAPIATPSRSDPDITPAHAGAGDASPEIGLGNLPAQPGSVLALPSRRIPTGNHPA